MKHDVVIRPASLADLNDLYFLAEQAGPGMTNFPNSKSLLQKKINWSQESFASSVETPGQEYYFFVMESLSEQRVVGCCGIFAKAGSEQPFYSYKLGKEVLFNKETKQSKQIDILYLVHDYHETSEIATLFLSPEHRKNRNGEFLSRVRFLFIAAHRARFAEQIIAEMRGVIDESGCSPFWDSLGKHFFDMNFNEADKMCGMGMKQFIADLMPKYPIYASLLSFEANAVIGKVHPSTEPARRLLEKENFSYEGYVDIFDGGATLQCHRDSIRTVKKSNTLPCQVVSTIEQPTGTAMLSNEQLDFRAKIAEFTLDSTEKVITVDQETAELLNLETGRLVRFIDFPI